jgi:hypothetical protein
MPSSIPPKPFDERVRTELVQINQTLGSIAEILGKLNANIEKFFQRQEPRQ